MDLLAFCGNPLDRASDRRGDPAWLAERLRDGLFLPFSKGRPLVAGNACVFLPWQADWKGAPVVFLGLENSQALFAVEGAASGGEFLEMRPAAFILPPRDCAIAGQAKAILDWNARHGFCANCGAVTEVQDGGWRRVCPGCGAEHFPRTDPVAIMLPVLGDECLVGRNARFPGAMFSAFAGFVEPGETLEEAVARELMEEARLTIGAVTYHASQPWPFVSSLMLGCYAQALSKDFQIDGAEIAEARWLTKAQVRARLADTEGEASFKLPATIAIAHRLLRDWVEC